MESLRTARDLLSLEEKWLREFDVVDPFNGNRLEGFLSLKPDHRYGALAIARVNEAVAPQLILGTPKLHYPFNKNGEFLFPPIESLLIYEKLDGTNVLAYRYHDDDGEEYLTYKLRLYPILRNGKWGAFLDMWRGILEEYPSIPSLPSANSCSISFELYGSQNAHLILYETPLACALLFGVTGEGRVRSPKELETLDVPTAELHAELLAENDPVAEYQRFRAESEKKNQKGDDDKIKGTEGTVWYVKPKSEEYVLFKCKPESVEEMHWATGINKAAVEMTCWNLLETEDTLTYEALLPLLLEDYTEREISGFRAHIEECISKVGGEMSFRIRVLEEYEKVGIKLSEDKGAVMRELSAKFARNEMKKVFTIISNHGHSN